MKPKVFDCPVSYWLLSPTKTSFFCPEEDFVGSTEMRPWSAKWPINLVQIPLKERTLANPTAMPRVPAKGKEVARVIRSMLSILESITLAKNTLWEALRQ